MMCRAILVSVSLLAAACGDPDPSPVIPLDGGTGAGHDAGGAGSGSGNIPGQLSLSVTSAQLRERMGFARPGAQRAFLEVAFALKNVNRATPLPVDAASFEVETADRLVFPEIPGDGVIANACPAKVFIESGGMLSCHVAFQIPENATLTNLLYGDDVARIASAAIATVAPALPACSYWKTSATDECFVCTNFDLFGNSCFVNGQGFRSSCSTELNSGCVNAGVCPQIAAGCTPSTACADAIRVLQTCLYDHCVGNCPLAGV